MIGGGGASNDYESDFTFLGSVQKVWGKQTVKIGLEHRRYYANVPSGGNVTDQTGSEIDSVPTMTPCPPVPGWLASNWVYGWLAPARRGRAGIPANVLVLLYTG